MLTYYFTTGLGTWFAYLSGNGVLPTVASPQEPSRTGAERALAFLVGALFISVAGLRYRIGVDYWQYAESWSYKYSQFEWREVSFNTESGFTLLTTLAAWWYNDPASMFFMASLVTIGLMVWTYAKYSPAFALSILLMVLAGSWHGSFNGVRQFLAAAVVLACFRLIVERRFLRFLLGVALASTFHFSAWICLLFYFVPRRVMSPPGFVLLLALVAGAVPSFDAIAAVIEDVRGQDVSESSYYLERVNPLRLVVAAGPALAYFLFVRRDAMSSAGHFLVNLTVVHTAVLGVSLASAYLARFTIYTQMFLPLTWAALAVALPKQTRVWLLPLVVLVYGLNWYLEISSVSALNPFRFIWTQ